MKYIKLQLWNMHKLKKGELQGALENLLVIPLTAFEVLLAITNLTGNFGFFNERG